MKLLDVSNLIEKRSRYFLFFLILLQGMVGYSQIPRSIIDLENPYSKKKGEYVYDLLYENKEYYLISYIEDRLFIQVLDSNMKEVRSTDHLLETDNMSYNKLEVYFTDNEIVFPFIFSDKLENQKRVLQFVSFDKRLAQEPFYYKILEKKIISKSAIERSELVKETKWYGGKNEYHNRFNDIFISVSENGKYFSIRHFIELKSTAKYPVFKSRIDLYENFKRTMSLNEHEESIDPTFFRQIGLNKMVYRNTNQINRNHNTLDFEAPFTVFNNGNIIFIQPQYSDKLLTHSSQTVSGIVIGHYPLTDSYKRNEKQCKTSLVFISKKSGLKEINLNLGKGHLIESLNYAYNEKLNKVEIYGVYEERKDDGKNVIEKNIGTFYTDYDCESETIGTVVKTPFHTLMDSLNNSESQGQLLGLIQKPIIINSVRKVGNEAWVEAQSFYGKEVCPTGNCDTYNGYISFNDFGIQGGTFLFRFNSVGRLLSIGALSKFGEHNESSAARLSVYFGLRQQKHVLNSGNRYIQFWKSKSESCFSKQELRTKSLKGKKETAFYCYYNWKTQEVLPCALPFDQAYDLTNTRIYELIDLGNNEFLVMMGDKKLGTICRKVLMD